MNLEQEAAAYSKGKQTQFVEGLRDHVNSLEKFLIDNLHKSQEREAAINSLTETVLWSKHCSEIHGIK